MSIFHDLDGQPLLQMAFFIAIVGGLIGNIAGFALKWAGEREHRRRR